MGALPTWQSLLYESQDMDHKAVKSQPAMEKLRNHLIPRQLSGCKIEDVKTRIMIVIAFKHC